MNKIKLFLLFFLLTTFNESNCQIRIENGKYATLNLHILQPTDLTNSQVSTGSHTLIKGTTNGVEGLWGFDTGWLNECAVKNNLVKSLGSLKIVNDMNHSYQEHSASLYSIILDGGVTLPSNQGTTLIWQNSFNLNGQTLDMLGILAINLFKDNVLVLDYINNQLTVYDPTYFANNFSLSDYKLISNDLDEYGVFLVPVTIKNFWGRSLFNGKLTFDTGNPNTFLSKKNVGTDYVSIYSTPSGQKFSFQQIPMSSNKVNYDGDLGYSSMNGHIFVLDYPNKNLYMYQPPWWELFKKGKVKH